MESGFHNRVLLMGVGLLAACGGNTGPIATPRAGQAVKLAFITQPTTTQGLQLITPGVRVAVQDSLGHTVASATNAVTVAVGANPTGDTLGGTTTVNAVNGIATFTTLAIGRPGSGYTLVATADTLVAATSAPFDIHVTFASVAAGTASACGVTTVGSIYCWGDNTYGELGNATTTSSQTPVPVSDGHAFATVSAGFESTCAVTTTGAAYCWGFGGYGQLGIGVLVDSAVTPVAVRGGLTFTTVSTGYDHTCGLTTRGFAYCWGANGRGELGTGGYPTIAGGPFWAVDSGLTYTGVSAGGQGFTCGVATLGEAYCWGLMLVAVNGTVLPASISTVPAAVPGGLSFAAVSTGENFACGVTTGAAAYCWPGGIGSGDSLNDTSRTPVAVAGGLHFASVSVGPVWACGVTSAGAAYCWGDNSYGELGNAATTYSATPLPVDGGLNFSAVSAGYYFTCGITGQGVVYCWGDNRVGELGNGTGVSSSVPVRVVQ